ncbi:MAG TPA: type II secretion system protein [Candidatus Eremiobacteraceae bacterium]|nr:type II secretion system protein [Candidatus Eremiobacteraceae bacterium]
MPETHNPIIGRFREGYCTEDVRLETRSARGFSLPELIVVVSVIAILLVIMILTLMHARENALVATCANNEERISEALDEYAADHQGRYPSSSGPVTSAIFGGPANPYMQDDSLIDPANGKPYFYFDGHGTCANTEAAYQIVDAGGHASSSLILLLKGEDDQDAIAFCADRGLYAFVSGSGFSASDRPDAER